MLLRWWVLPVLHYIHQRPIISSIIHLPIIEQYGKQHDRLGWEHHKFTLYRSTAAARWSSTSPCSGGDSCKFGFPITQWLKPTSSLTVTCVRKLVYIRRTQDEILWLLEDYPSSGIYLDFFLKNHLTEVGLLLFSRSSWAFVTADRICSSLMLLLLRWRRVF